MKKYFILIISITLFFNNLSSANNKEEPVYPIVGKICPDWTLTDVNGKTFKISDLRGKRIILDFWAEWCTSCIQGFPKMNKLQSKFGKDVEVILVGKETPNARKAYEKYKKRYSLELTSVIDSAIFTAFKIRGVPTSIWIDSDGVVKAISSSSEASEITVERFIKGDKLDLFDSGHERAARDKKIYNRNKLFQVEGNGGADGDFLFRSMLTVWKSGIATGGDVSINNQLGKFERLRASVPALFTTAYTGMENMRKDFYQWPLLESTDSAFIRSFEIGGIRDSYYCYSLKYPDSLASMEKTMEFMQEDLKRYFNHSGYIVEREMPCLILTMIDKSKVEKLRTKGGKTTYVESPVGIDVKNISITNFADYVKMSVGKNGERVVNAVQIDFNIDFYGEVLAYDFDSVKRLLNRHGMDIKRGSNMMKVLVVKENPKN